MRHTDKERLDWMEKLDGMGLISDDAGRWAISAGGMQNIPDPEKPIAISTVFCVEAGQWRKDIRSAIDYAIEAEGK